MNLEELSHVIADNCGVPEPRAIEVVKSMLTAIALTAEQGKRVTFRGFGVFEPVTRKEKLARNPRTGQPVTIPSYRTLKFRPSKNIIAQLTAAAAAKQQA